MRCLQVLAGSVHGRTTLMNRSHGVRTLNVIHKGCPLRRLTASTLIKPSPKKQLKAPTHPCANGSRGKVHSGPSHLPVKAGHKQQPLLSLAASGGKNSIRDTLNELYLQNAQRCHPPCLSTKQRIKHTISRTLYQIFLITVR